MLEFLVDVILFALSLCADCFAVSLCSSFTLKKITFKDVARAALIFAVIQSGLFVVGYEFGHLLVGFVEKAAHLIGFVLLLYVGGSMVLKGIRDEKEVEDLNDWKRLIIGGIATSIDALAVGVSLSMTGQDWAMTIPQAISIFVFTALSVVVGIVGGKKIGEKAGRWAEIIGGCVLIGIGVSILL